LALARPPSRATLRSVNGRCNVIDYLGNAGKTIELYVIQLQNRSYVYGKTTRRTMRFSMYLAKHVGGWSMVKIGKFYNGRHHTTVLHAIRKVEQLRMADDSVDALIEVLVATLRSEPRRSPSGPTSDWQALLIETVARRVLQRLAQFQLSANDVPGRCTESGTY
jgi:hypothetical protein